MMAYLMLWFTVGIIWGVVNLLSAVLLVASMSPGESGRFRRRTLYRHVVSYGLIAIFLAMAVRQSWLAGLAMVGGMWVARWVGVYWGATGRLNRLWSR